MEGWRIEGGLEGVVQGQVRRWDGELKEGWRGLWRVKLGGGMDRLGGWEGRDKLYLRLILYTSWIV